LFSSVATRRPWISSPVPESLGALYGWTRPTYPRGERSRAQLVRAPIPVSWYSGISELPGVAREAGLRPLRPVRWSPPTLYTPRRLDEHQPALPPEDSLSTRPVSSRSPLYNQFEVVLPENRFIRKEGVRGSKGVYLLTPLELRQRALDREVSLSTSFLYRNFGIRGYNSDRTGYPNS
jgi:hypothetical protein